MASVTYAYYSQVYGGGLSEAAFVDMLPAAETHVRWLCSLKQACVNSTPYKRAVCAVVDVFAEFGQGQVSGIALGDFRVTRYASDEGVTGEDMATKAALKELCGTGMAFCGVR